MLAKTELFTRLQYINAASNLPVLMDNGIGLSEHNGVANLLRKGLGIVAFNILEDFIKNKSSESLTILSHSRIPFNNLTEDLKKASTSGALQNLLFQANLEKKEGRDSILLIQEESQKIHSTKMGTFELSKYSFFHGGSNISSNEITEFLKSFGISGGWQILKMVSDSIGGGLLDLAQTYQNTATRRHNAAHSASFNYDYSWIESIKNDILAISASFDILITARCRQVLSNLGKKINEHNLLSALNYRFLEYSNDGKYRETTILGGRARKKWDDLQTAINSIQPRLSLNDEFLIIINASRRIEDWYT